MVILPIFLKYTQATHKNTETCPNTVSYLLSHRHTHIQQLSLPRVWRVRLNAALSARPVTKDPAFPTPPTIPCSISRVSAHHKHMTALSAAPICRLQLPHWRAVLADDQRHTQRPRQGERRAAKLGVRGAQLQPGSGPHPFTLALSAPLSTPPASASHVSSVRLTPSLTVLSLPPFPAVYPSPRLLPSIALT